MMTNALKLGLTLGLALFVTACGGGHRGAARAQRAAVALNAPAGPTTGTSAAGRSPRQIEDEIFTMDIKLKSLSYYGFNRPTAISIVNDFIGYDADTRRRIRAVALTMLDLGRELRAAGERTKTEAAVTEGLRVAAKAEHLLRKMRRLDQREIALGQMAASQRALKTNQLTNPNQG